MRYFILAATAVIATAGAFILSGMGMDYMNPDIAHGLHPAIAFPMAAVLLCLVGVLVFIYASSEDVTADPLDDQEQAVINLAKQGIYLNRHGK